MSTPTQVCATCGVPLMPDQAFCSNCGTRYADPSLMDPTQQASYSSPQAPFPQQGDPYADQGTPHNYAQYSAETQNVSPPPPPDVTPIYRDSGYYRQAGNVYPQFPQNSQPKKGPNIWLVLGIIFAAVLLCGCGGFFLLGSIYHPPVANGGGTPTADMTMTPSPTAIPTPQALFSDNFADNHNNWNIPQQPGYSIAVSNNMLTMSEANHKALLEQLPDKQSYGDVAVTLAFTYLQGDKNDFMDLLLRSSGGGANEQGYYISIAGDNTYSISKAYPDPNDNTKNKFMDLVAPATSPALHPQGQQNIMKVIAKGSSIVLLLNDSVVTTITDNTFTSGPIVLVLENGDTSNSIKVNFSNIAVYDAPAQLPS